MPTKLSATFIYFFLLSLNLTDWTLSTDLQILSLFSVWWINSPVGHDVLSLLHIASSLLIFYLFMENIDLEVFYMGLVSVSWCC